MVCFSLKSVDSELQTVIVLQTAEQSSTAIILANFTLGTKCNTNISFPSKGIGFTDQ